MKKLFYLLFIGSIVLTSCTKQEPIEVTCDCIGSSSNSLDTALVGHWKATGLTSDNGISFNNDQIDLYIESDGSYVIMISVNNNPFNNFGTITEVSDTVIKIAPVHDSQQIIQKCIFNYSIQNNIITFSNDIGQSDRVWACEQTGEQRFWNRSGIPNHSIEINNLTKEH